MSYLHKCKPVCLRVCVSVCLCAVHGDATRHNSRNMRDNTSIIYLIFSATILIHVVVHKRKPVCLCACVPEHDLGFKV